MAFFSNHKDAKDLVSRWYEYANNNPFKPIDATFLDRRINILSEENRDLKRKIVEAQKLLEQALYIFSGDAA